MPPLKHSNIKKESQSGPAMSLVFQRLINIKPSSEETPFLHLLTIHGAWLAWALLMFWLVPVWTADLAFGFFLGWLLMLLNLLLFQGLFWLLKRRIRKWPLALFFLKYALWGAYLYWALFLLSADPHGFAWGALSFLASLLGYGLWLIRLDKKRVASQRVKPTDTL
jgi:hypothetical protein